MKPVLSTPSQPTWKTFAIFGTIRTFPFASLQTAQLHTSTRTPRIASSSFVFLKGPLKSDFTPFSMLNPTCRVVQYVS